MLSPYARIVGKRIVGTPAFFALVQTEGSYYHHTKWTRVAAVLKPSMSDCVQKRVQTVQSAVSSSEAEWHSVAFGLQLALEEGERSVALENDNFGVIRGLVTPDAEFRHEYARHYKDQILRMARRAEWVGARWIPREVNRADVLFREGGSPLLR